MVRLFFWLKVVILLIVLFLGLFLVVALIMQRAESAVATLPHANASDHTKISPLATASNMGVDAVHTRLLADRAASPNDRCRCRLAVVTG